MMKKRFHFNPARISSLAAFLLLAFGASIGHAYFFDYGVGVRPTGLGRAFVAVADDANTVNYNPAGLAILDRYEITTMFASLFTGFEGRLYTGARDALGYNYVGIAVPIDPEIGYFGASWAQFGSYFYHENTFTVGYARTLTYKTERVHVGANLKILNWSVQGNDYTDPLSKTAFTADIAALYPLPENFMAGMCIENIIPADVGMTTKEEIPRNFRIGASWSQDLKPLGAVIDDVLLSFELVNRSYMQNKNTVRFGAESWFFNGIAAARMGVNSTEFSISLSGKYMFAELNDTLLQLDYSFSLPFYIQDTYGTHRVALTASWPQAKGSKMERAEKALADALKAEEEENLNKQQEEKLKQARAEEEARLRAMIEKLKAEIKAVEEEVAKIQSRIESRDLPQIMFAPGKSILKKESLKTLDEIGRILSKHAGVKVQIEGHTDSTGDAKKNMTLSQSRAEAVCEYLVHTFKLKSDNVIPIGYGETQPVADNKTEEGRRKNRRVEIKMLVPKGLEETVEESQPEDGKEFEANVESKDVVSQETLEKLREKLKVYEMEMNTDEVEELFQQQHNKQRKGGNEPTDIPSSPESEP